MAPGISTHLLNSRARQDTYVFTGEREGERFMERLLLFCLLFVVSAACAADSGLRVGTASSEFEAEDSMVIAGGITPGKATGQEGKLRAVAVVLDKKPAGKLAIVACDILMITREHLDPVTAEIEKLTGISTDRILINSTHTHHAPSTMVVHGYGLDETFTRRVQRGIVDAVQQANANLSSEDCQFYFHLGAEQSVGQNSRMLLSDGRIYWIGPREDFVRPTGPFDPELPVLAFRAPDDKLRAVIFNHSTHTIGTKQPSKRSPSFYGLAAQELEAELGGTFCFLEGASGSTHNLDLNCTEMTSRIKEAVRKALVSSKPHSVEKLTAIKRPFTFKVRTFNEAAEEEAVTQYCKKYASSHADQLIPVFRKMRMELAPRQGQVRETWLQVMRIGDVAIVGVPAEFFTQLGLDIKNRSPFRYTYVAELANDWIGYIPNREGHKLGGYQCWTGFHSYAEPGTGERIVDATIEMLKELERKE
jgi:neutral ceramidase